MKSSELRYIVRECIQEVLTEGEKVCGWCNKPMGSDPRITGVSHGICPDCFSKEIKKAKPQPQSKPPEVATQTH